MAHKNVNLTEAEKLARDEFIASDAGIKYYAKEAIDMMRDLTDLNDEEIYDEIVNSSEVTESEQEILAEMLGLL